MGCSCSGDAKYRFKMLVRAIYDKDVDGNYIAEEDALGKIKSYAERNPERIPRICRKISKIMHIHLRHHPIQVQRVLVSVKIMTSLLRSSDHVEPFVPPVIDMVTELFQRRRYAFYIAGADLLTVLTMKLVATNAHSNTRRLLKDHSTSLLPPLQHMIRATSLIDKRPKKKNAGPAYSAVGGQSPQKRSGSVTSSGGRGSSSGKTGRARFKSKGKTVHRKKSSAPQHASVAAAAAGAEGEGKREEESAQPTPRRRRGVPDGIRIQTSNTPLPEEGDDDFEDVERTMSEELFLVDEDEIHFSLMNDNNLPEKVAMLSGGLVAMGNLGFCVPDLVQEMMVARTVKVIVKHILHTVRHNVFLQNTTRGSPMMCATPPVAPGAPSSSSFSPLERLPSTAVFQPPSESPQEAEAHQQQAEEQEHQMRVVQRSALHALCAIANAVTASAVDQLTRMVLECFEEEGKEGAWVYHSAVDLVFHALAKSLERQSQKLGMCLCTALAYVVYLSKNQLHNPPQSLSPMLLHKSSTSPRGSPLLPVRPTSVSSSPAQTDSATAPPRHESSTSHTPLGVTLPGVLPTGSHGSSGAANVEGTGSVLHNASSSVFPPNNANNSDTISPTADGAGKGRLGRKFGFVPDVAAAAAAAARPPVLPEQIPKAFASPASLGGFLRALHQCLLIIPMTGTRPHIFLGAIQVLMSETVFLSSCVASVPSPLVQRPQSPLPLPAPAPSSGAGTLATSALTSSMDLRMFNSTFCGGLRGSLSAPIEDARGCGGSKQQQGFDVVLISLTTALLSAIHAQKNYPALHLVLHYLVERSSEELGANTANTALGSGGGGGGGRRMRSFMLRLLESTAAYLRALPDTQRWDVDLFPSIFHSLYDLRHPRALSEAAIILCQLLAGRPKIVPGLVVPFGSHPHHPSSRSRIHLPEPVMTRVEESRPVRGGKRVMMVSHPSMLFLSPTVEGNASQVFGPAKGSPPPSSRQHGTQLHTSLPDLQRAQEWIICLSRIHRQELTPRLLLVLGNVFAAYMAGAGVQGMPFVLRCAWSIFIQFGGRCGAENDDYDDEERGDVMECSESSVDEPSPKSHQNGSNGSSNNKTNAIPVLQHAAGTTFSLEQNRAWQQLVLAVLAHMGVIYGLPELTSYIKRVWRRKAAAGELSAHTFSPDLRTNWEVSSDGDADGDGASSRQIVGEEFIRCGLELHPELLQGPAAEPSSSILPHTNRPSFAHSSTTSSRWGIDKPLTDEENGNSPHTHPQQSFTAEAEGGNAATGTGVPLSFIKIARILAQAPREDIEGVFSCIVVQEEDEAALVEAIVQNCFSGAAAEAFEAETTAILLQRMKAANEQHNTSISNSLLPAAAASPLLGMTGSASQPQPSAFPSPQQAQQLSSVEYLNIIEDLARGGSRRRQELQANNSTNTFLGGNASGHSSSPTFSTSGTVSGAKGAIKYAVGDRVQMRKTLISFDKKEAMVPAADEAAVAGRKKSKLDQLMSYYKVSLHQTAVEMGLFDPPRQYGSRAFRNKTNNNSFQGGVEMEKDNKHHTSSDAQSLNHNNSATMKMSIGNEVKVNDVSEKLQEVGSEMLPPPVTRLATQHPDEDSDESLPISPRSRLRQLLAGGEGDGYFDDGLDDSRHRLDADNEGEGTDHFRPPQGSLQGVSPQRQDGDSYPRRAVSPSGGLLFNNQSAGTFDSQDSQSVFPSHGIPTPTTSAPLRRQYKNSASKLNNSNNMNSGLNGRRLPKVTSFDLSFPVESGEATPGAASRRRQNTPGPASASLTTPTTGSSKQPHQLVQVHPISHQSNSSHHLQRYTSNRLQRSQESFHQHQAGTMISPGPSGIQQRGSSSRNNTATSQGNSRAAAGGRGSNGPLPYPANYHNHTTINSGGNNVFSHQLPMSARGNGDQLHGGPGELWAGTLDKLAVSAVNENNNTNEDGDPTWVSRLPMWQYLSIP